MDYPDVLTYEQLMTTSADYSDRTEFCSDVDIFYRGGRHMEAAKRKFLSKRLDEKPEVYTVRLNRFTYTNLLSQILVKVLGRFSTGSVVIEGLSDRFADVWGAFREEVDEESEEKLFVPELLKQVMLYQTCVVQVDRPKGAGAVNRYEEMEAGALPYVCIYKPQEVLNSGDDWYKFYTLTAIADPFSAGQHLACWRFIDAEYIAEYSALVETDGDRIKAIIHGGERLPLSPTVEVPLTSLTPHGFGQVPVQELSIPDEHYAAGQAFLKLKQYLNVENCVTDTSLTSGYVQRIFTPLAEKGDDFSVIKEDEFFSDNAHVVKGAGFKFEEATGSSIDVNLKFLEKIELQIEKLVCISPGESTQSAMVRAAASKKIDEGSLELMLVSYGSLIVSFYQNILQLVAIALGDLVAATDLRVSGLDTFSLDSLPDDIDIALKVEPMISHLSESALKAFYTRISQELNPNASAAEKATIESEVQSMDMVPPVPDTLPEDTDGRGNSKGNVGSPGKRANG